MADVTVTRQDVALAAGTGNFSRVRVGEAVTQGQVLYRAASDSKHYKAAATSVTLAQAVGVAMTAASADGYVLMLKSGDYVVGGTLSQGITYVVSATAGGVAPASDLASTNLVTNLGIAISSSVLKLDIAASGIALP